MSNVAQSVLDHIATLPAADKEIACRCLGSLGYFTRLFFSVRTGKDFVVSQPQARESHHKILWRELTNLFYLRTKNLYINIHPGSGKSEICRGFVAWTIAHYPDCNFLYVSFSEERAQQNTAIIRDIIALPLFRKLFGVRIHHDYNAKGNFKTTAGGTITAFGSAGSITGADAGLPGLDRFSGGVIMDDMHKPDEVASDTVRAKVISNYVDTVSNRPRGENVMMLAIGQRLHEDDIFTYFDEHESKYWQRVILPTEDRSGNILYPEVNTPDKVSKAKLSEYSWAAQHQQNPIPAGGGIFKREWFPLLDDEPDILSTFITADTAETSKTYNDPTVFAFWGLYRIKQAGELTDLYALHWLDCIEIWVEPKDLLGEFMQFYAQCMRHKIKPNLAVIEKKSTGSTLGSILEDMQGLQIIKLDRNASTGSKADRFLAVQSYISSKRVTISSNAKHRNLVLDHMSKITANMSHRHDDIADCCEAAIKIALVDRLVLASASYTERQAVKSNALSNVLNYQINNNRQQINYLWG